MWSIWLWVFPSGEIQVCLWMFSVATLSS
jgi:hypothetical protein